MASQAASAGTEWRSVILRYKFLGQANKGNGSFFPGHELNLSMENNSGGMRMQDAVEKLLSTFTDLYSSPKPERIAALESKLAEIGFDGLHIGAPETVDASMAWIPAIGLLGSSRLRAWEVDARKNPVLVSVDLDRATSRAWPLHRPPAKKVKLPPKAARPVGEAAEAREYACIPHFVGESMPEGLLPGEYAISLVEWDRVSNIRLVKKTAKPPRASARPNTPPPKAPSLPWPWDFWSANPALFEAQAESAKLEGETGIAMTLSGTGASARLVGRVAFKPRPIHLIPKESQPKSGPTDIQAGIRVDLLQFTQDHSVPERIQIMVPIHHSAPVKPGEILVGWFAYPFPRLQRKEETLVYAFADCLRSEPMRIPAQAP